MNLLVTNTYATQSYAVIRALRPYAAKIVATTEGENSLWAISSHAAYSRLVDVRYRVPSPVKDWRAGNIQRENTEREEAFIKALVRICEEEKIDVVFPSWDPHVYVLSKNKRLLEGMGVVIPLPDYDTVLTALDKYRTVRAAQEVGVCCPRTYLYERKEDLKWIAEQLGFPLVIKPRFTSGGRGMAIVNNYEDLLEQIPVVVENHSKPMIQEYIPGGERGSVQFVLDRDGQLLFAFRKKRQRKFRLTASFGTVSESELVDEHVFGTARLVNKLGWWGCMAIETIIDPRDGLYKLMEINPRFPRQLWNRTELGINEPLMCVKVAKGEAVEPVRNYPVGVVFVSPIEDIQLLALQLLDLLVYRVRHTLRKSAPLDRLNPPLSVHEQIHSFMQTYLGGKQKIFDPHFRYFFRDPVVSILWWLRFCTWMLGAFKKLGR